MRWTTTRRTRRRQIRCLSVPSKVQLGGRKDEGARDTAADVRLDLAGAHQHHLLVHLVNLVVHLDQVEFGDLTNMEALTKDDRWLLPPSCFFRLHIFLCIRRAFQPACCAQVWVMRKGGVCVSVRATLALQRISACV
jgi:hypothetical protein